MDVGGGDDGGDEVGDGGPRLDRGTNAWGEGAVELDADGTRFDGTDAEAEDRLELENRFRMVSGDMGDMGGVGGIFVVSRENRFVVLTERPASCKDRIRSAMLPPDLCSMPFELGKS